VRPYGGSVYCGLVRIMNFFFLVLFFYYHIMFVRVMDTTICLLFCAECSKIVVISIGPYSCVLCRIWRTYADCGLLDMMKRMCSLNLNSSQ